MTKRLKFVFIVSYVLLGIFQYTYAESLSLKNPFSLLNLNVQAHKNLTKDNAGGQRMVRHILAKNYDFVTTQEADTGTYPLTDSGFGGMGQNYTLSYLSSDSTANPDGKQWKNRDANIYFRTERWTQLKTKEITITPDKRLIGGDPSRIAFLGKFKSKDTGYEVTVVNTHYCINWYVGGVAGSGSAGCNDVSNMIAHLTDSISIAEEIKRFAGSSPVVFVGDFNNQYVDEKADNQNPDNVRKAAVEAAAVAVALEDYSFDLVKGISPKFMGGPIIDFVYYNKGLTLQLDKPASIYPRVLDGQTIGVEDNTSDHDGIIVNFDFTADSPPSAPPVSLACEAPLMGKEIKVDYTPVKGSWGKGTVTVDSSNSANVNRVEFLGWNSAPLAPKAPPTIPVTDPVSKGGKMIIRYDEYKSAPGEKDGFKYFAKHYCADGSSKVSAPIYVPAVYTN